MPTLLNIAYKSQYDPDAAASLLLSRLIPRISRSTWEAGPQQVADAYQALLTRDAIAAAERDEELADEREAEGNPGLGAGDGPE